MARVIRLLLAYDGTAYCGWQKQCQGEVTIQETIEQKLRIICRHTVTLHGAGRTDAGVHALGMVAHFHTQVHHPLSAFVEGLNSLLPSDIRILEAEEAAEDFHSRFSAKCKTYRYDFFTGQIVSPEKRLYMGHFPGFFQPFHAQKALRYLVGTHDFSSFEHAGSRNKEATGRGAIRTLFSAECLPMPNVDQGWSLRLCGDGFLRQMVRIIAGTVIEIGQMNKKNRLPENIQQILLAQDRAAAGKTAPACGLFLEKVTYLSFE